MPENDKERLIEGKGTVTPSSDEAIEATVEKLRREIHDLPEDEEILEGDQLIIKPFSPVKASGVSGSFSVNQAELHELDPDNVIRLTVQRDQLTAASRAGVSRKNTTQLKRLLKAA